MSTQAELSIMLCENFIDGDLANQAELESVCERRREADQLSIDLLALCGARVGLGRCGREGIFVAVLDIQEAINT